jgi:hypothetical protein
MQFKKLLVATFSFFVLPGLMWAHDPQYELWYNSSLKISDSFPSPADLGTLSQPAQLYEAKKKKWGNLNLRPIGYEPYSQFNSE